MVVDAVEEEEASTGEEAAEEVDSNIRMTVRDIALEDGEEFMTRAAMVF